MCRLYGQISATAEDAADFLADAQRSLLHQSNCRPNNLQKDGWGIAYFSGNRTKVIKSANAAFSEEDRFKSLAYKVRSRVVIGHLRAASNPQGLSPKSLFNIKNNQPYTDGKILFAHNGTVNISPEVAKLLGPLQRRIRGNNDSEIYFWQFVKFHNAFQNIPEALKACVRELWTLWKDCRSRYPNKKKPYTGLNTLVSDGRSLHALCHYPSRPGARSLYNRRQRWGTMSLARRGKRYIVASEDMDANGWSHLHEPEIVSLTLHKSGISVRRERFKAGA